MKAANVLGIKQQNEQTEEVCWPCAVKAEAMERTSPPNTRVNHKSSHCLYSDIITHEPAL